MFWAFFSYDSKGPCYIWEEETPQEKKEAKKWMDKVNTELEAQCKLEWELTTSIRRVRITRNIRGKKPKWKWSKKTSKLKRKVSKGGIDWYRYYKEILQKKLLSFAKQYKLSCLDMIVQEDNASLYAYRYQGKVYSM
jgi:hypothetical protein